MSIMLPGIVADALDILGFTWPNLDEDKIREHARAWKTFAADLEYVISDTDRAARTVAQDNHGESINAFTQHWAGVGGQGDLREAADAANLVGDALEIFAGIVEGLKYAVIAEASATAALIVGTAGAALLARGALTAVLRKLKKEAIEEILDRIVPKLSQEAKERFARILRNPVPDVFGRRPALAGVPANPAGSAPNPNIPNPNIMAMLGGGGRGGTSRSPKPTRHDRGGDKTPDNARDKSSLSPSDRRSVESYEKLITEHKDKLDAYRADPDKFDHKGILKNAPNDEVRQRIIDGRIRHLEKEIQAFENNIEKIFRGRG